MNLIKATYSIIFALLLLSSSTNFHALSHLLESDDLDNIEHCDTCDEFTYSQVEKSFIIQPSVEAHTHNTYVSAALDLFKNTSVSVSLKQSGQFYNKPPPTFS
ncbi:hypothetical protein [Psychroflexus sp. ALD_RP9]|uniref:hypothetical protein n=1 Tax=Psychroflexus sp. ALD_RP9 TaxID=2777186 RepID=UPI001A8FEF86|nr:hypothetical protein [Psychroflexus sp. ALD_RP9]QSS97069.1 hypothetical protein IMZ30_11595 [Psychroflexus sp. ALD_RP9]